MMKNDYEHPMIKSLGEVEFKRILDSFPQEYDDSWEGNFKPVAMTLIWVTKSGRQIIADNILDAYNYWVGGMTIV